MNRLTKHIKLRIGLIIFLLWFKSAYCEQDPQVLLKQKLNEMYGFTPTFDIQISSNIPRTIDLKEEGFYYTLHKKTICIYAKNKTAQTFGVYRVLEEIFHCDYLSSNAIEMASLNPQPSSDITINKIRLEKKKLLESYLLNGFPSLQKKCNPAFDYREIFYGECRKGEYPNFHALNNTPETAFEKHPGWGMWVHTLHKLLPPQIHFKSHPEYYALRNGKRMEDQVCMSSEEALKIVVNNLALAIKENPSAKYWSVSQMDNYNYCECGKCHQTDSIEGSHAGSLIRFVNQVASHFPEKIISTLAYQYSRSAPKISKPLSNVNIMLCTIESDRSMPIKGSDFERDLRNWSALTKEILVWDYVINFSHLISPFPNWHVLAPNLRMFQEYGCKMVFEQGLNQVGGEMEPMRAWILAKLVWDPTLDADSLRVHFAKNYYGDASPEILEMLMLQMEALLLSGKPLTLYEPPATHINGYLHPELLVKYHHLLNKALEKTSGNTIVQDRIKMVQQGIYYATLECMKLPNMSFPWILANNLSPQENTLGSDILNYVAMLDSLTFRAERWGPSLFHETRLRPKEYRTRTLYQWKHTLSNHLAKNKPIKYLIAPDKSYRAGSVVELNQWLSKQAINNGIKGDIDYQFNWSGWWGKNAELIIDLDTIKEVKEIKINYLENNQAWIMGPEKMLVQTLKLNPKDSTFLVQNSYEVVNNNVGEKIPDGVYSLQLQVKKLEYCRYIKIIVVNPGKLPAWRGVNDNGWLFIDEVEVD